MNVHLILDMLSGLFMIASPWLFGFADAMWLPQVVIGCVEIFTALMTQTKISRMETEASEAEDIQQSPIPAYA